MISHDSDWIVDAPREEVWSALHPQKDFDRKQTTIDNPRHIAFDNVRIEVLHEGDENGEGLVRRTWFAVPWYVGGKARSWEIVSEVRAPEYQRYDAVMTPPHCYAIGWYRLEALDGDRTRVHFHEEFRIEKGWLRWLERPIHRFLSADNDKNLKGIIEQAVAARRANSRASVAA
ncbi:SRPBCC family protein [Sphingomonas bacterium]|uniref:SRPBCC family protein n=1 Tax=Sphingomonas bacterium TaxID=1895847 RepID=UPI001575864D|nr:SRPBCC family protein [Sphingomonas bacterium]